MNESEYNMEVLKIWKTHSNIRLPSHQTQESACFDLAFQSAGKKEITGYNSYNRPISRPASGKLTLAPGDRILVPTGFILDIPKGYSVRVHARSGLSLKQGLILANSEGIIDSDYVNELFVMLWNISDNMIVISEGDRIAQAELVKSIEYIIEETPARPIQKTNRVGGLGSTGISHMEDMVILNIEDMVRKFPTPEIPAKRGRGRPRKNA